MAATPRGNQDPAPRRRRALRGRVAAAVLVVLAAGGRNAAAQGLSCLSAVAASCGVPIAGALPGPATGGANAYNCAAGTWDADETVYRITVPSLSDVYLGLASSGGAMAAFLLGSCSESSCLAGGSMGVDAFGVMPGTYYVVVDAPTPADGGAYVLTITCTPIATPIDCGETLTGDTTLRPNRVQDQACGTPADWTGPDVVFEVDFTPPGNLVATVASGTGQGAFIFDASLPLVPGNCLAGGAGGAILYSPPAGPYLVVVDGPAASDGSFLLSVECSPVLSCSPAPATVACLDVVAGTTVGQDAFVGFYRCDDVLHDGPEAVYAFDSGGRQIVSFLLESPDPRLDIFLLDACNEASCVAWGDALISASLDVGRYYLVVDGREGAASDFTLRSFCGAGLEPATVSFAGVPGDCFDEHKIGWLTPELALADVVFAIDLTASMGGEVAALRDNMQAIMDNLQGFITDISYGLIAYKDYPSSPVIPAPCSYSNAYGGPGDYPYRLVQDVTSDRLAMQAAVDGLVVGGGGDGPESFNRMLFEAANDPALTWRPGARRMLVDFGDDMPHDCNVLACLGETAPSSLGVDLGRDDLPNTADDLETLPVIQGLVDADIVLIHFDSSGGGSVAGRSYTEIWDCWARATGGIAEALETDGTVPPNIGGLNCDPAVRADCLAELVADRVLAHGSACPSLGLAVEPGFEAWLVDAGPRYSDVLLPAVETFDIRFCIPPGTPSGPYDFEVVLTCGGGFVASQQVHFDVRNPCAPAVTTEPSDAVICEGGVASLDASGMSLADCPGTVLHEWRDGTGAVVGTAPSLDVSPTAPETYTVQVSCSTDPACFAAADAFVDVELPPILPGMTVRDPAPCNLGLELTWDPAQFRDPSGTGVYNVYRSEIDCADALAQAPVVLGVPDLRWVDTATVVGPSYWYVVQAEDARTSTLCAAGPDHGGAVNTDVVCFGPMQESIDASIPEGPAWPLRLRHASDIVVLSWTGSRALRAGEHYHLLKGYSPGGIAMINPEGQVRTDWTEIDASRPLQFFDVRIANRCEMESIDDEPPGWDVPHP